MYKIILICMIVCLSVSAQAQVFFKKAIKQAPQIANKQGQSAIGQLLLKNSNPQNFNKMLLKKIHGAVPAVLRQNILLKNQIMRLPLPSKLDEKALYPLAQASARLLHPGKTMDAILAETWFKKNARYAVNYAQNKNGTVKDMTTYYVAWLYSNCLLHKAHYPAYGQLQKVLEAKYGALNFKEVYHQEL